MPVLNRESFTPGTVLRFKELLKILFGYVFLQLCADMEKRVLPSTPGPQNIVYHIVRYKKSSCPVTAGSRFAYNIRLLCFAWKKA